MVEFTYQTVFQFLQTVGILVGVFYYVMTIRANQRNQQLQLETRQAQLYMQIFGRMSSMDFRLSTTELSRWEWRDFDDFDEKYLKNSDPSYSAKWQSLMSHLEGLGYLLKDGLIDAEALYLSWGQIQISAWKRWEPIVKAYRVSRNNEDFGRWFEYLGEQLIEYRVKRGLPAAWSPEEMKFIEE